MRDLGVELRLRRLLWFSHGHDGLYGDDGEMQCPRCGVDFKRADVATIESAVLALLSRPVLDVSPAAAQSIGSISNFHPNQSVPIYSSGMVAWVALHKFSDGAVWLLRRSPELGFWITCRLATELDIQTIRKATSQIRADYGPNGDATTPGFFKKEERCIHKRLNEDGICRECGADCRSAG